MNMYKKEIKGKYNFVKNKKYIKYIIYIIYIHMEKKKKKVPSDDQSNQGY